MPHHFVEYDAVGHEIARRTVPPEPLSEPTYSQALFGMIFTVIIALEFIESFPMLCEMI